jgi:3-keto-5-aminohexanoate cleavage enzyme
VTKKLIIGVHPNENTMREPNPNVPWTPDEIARDAADCVAAGASVMHFHGRTSTGEPDHSPGTYGEIMRAVRERTDILFAPSLANAPGNTVHQRLSNVVDTAGDPKTRADFLVLDMGCANMDLFDPATKSFASAGKVFVNDTVTHQHVLARARELGLKPYLSSFTVGWTRTIFAHLDAGAIDEPVVIAFILGGPEFLAAHPATVEGLRAQLAFLPEGRRVEWIVSAYRGNVLRVAEAAIELGGHVSIGTGDYHYEELGHPTNAELVARVADLARAHGREVATADEARDLLDVKGGVPCSS